MISSSQWNRLMKQLIFVVHRKNYCTFPLEKKGILPLKNIWSTVSCPYKHLYFYTPSLPLRPQKLLSLKQYIFSWIFKWTVRNRGLCYKKWVYKTTCYHLCILLGICQYLVLRIVWSWPENWPKVYNKSSLLSIFFNSRSSHWWSSFQGALKNFAKFTWKTPAISKII